MLANSKTGDGPAGTQTSRAVIELRNMIAEGSIPAGERLTEVQLADQLNMSRTPIRAAIQQLRNEGLLEPQPAGGYTIRGFTPDEIREAIELRGLTEGLAARLLAEHGADKSAFAGLCMIAGNIDDLLRGQNFGSEQLADYATLNAEFHEALAGATGSGLIVEEARRANARPFAWASAFVEFHKDMVAARRHLLIAQDQHRAVLEAIEHREGARAEAIMREHARLTLRNLTSALRARAQMDGVRGGVSLILRFA